MPIYEYVCEKCGKLNELLQKLTDPPPDRCDSCGTNGPLPKVVSRSSFVLKGGGWYSDLYGSTKKEGSSSGGASSSSSGSNSGSTAPSTPASPATPSPAATSSTPSTSPAKTS